MDINFELYKIFYHAAKTGNFSNAAKKLFISQSAVSQAIANLERKTGFQLFLRKNRQVVLTHEGELLFKHIEQAYNFIKTAEGKIEELKTLDSGIIRIGVGDTICKYYLIPYLEKFNLLFPKIKIQIINRTSSQIVSILKDGLIDLGIITLQTKCFDKSPIETFNTSNEVSSDETFDENIAVDEFATVEDILVASDKFIHLKGKSITLNELTTYPFLLLQKNSATRRNLDNMLKNEGIELIPEIELESVDLLVEFAKIGLGIAHVLKLSATAQISKGELFEVKTVEMLPQRQLGIIRIKNVPPSRSSVQFIKLLKPK